MNDADSMRVCGSCLSGYNSLHECDAPGNCECDQPLHLVSAQARRAQAAADVAVSEDAARMFEQIRKMGVPQRPNWDEYFLGIAKAVAARADCRRRQHGAVVVKDNRIRATGYNAAAPGGPSCLAGECPRGLAKDLPSGSSYDTGPGTCVSLHAEQNALLFASRDDCEGGIIYITGKPCQGCWRMIQGSGLKTVCYLTADYLGWTTHETSVPYDRLH